MLDNDPPIDLDTADQIWRAGDYIAHLRERLDAGQALTLDEQRKALAIALSALLQLRHGDAARWTEGRALPGWLVALGGHEG